MNVVYVLKSHAGPVVAIFSHSPSKLEREIEYEKYLGKEIPDGTADWNCHLERWIVDAGFQDKTQAALL